MIALIPAGGAGARMGAATPKQYLRLHNATVLEHTVRPFLACPHIAQVFVILAPDDTLFTLNHARITVLRVGGVTRRDSVFNGLNALHSQLAAHDWVLVHDAARPGLTPDLLEQLIEQCVDDPVGGLLALPVADTLKRADAQGRVQATVAREHLWAAQTPQMFRYGLLLEALRRSPDVTDESSAMEALGLQPKLVPGDWRNFKLTYPQDLQRAEHCIGST